MRWLNKRISTIRDITAIKAIRTIRKKDNELKITQTRGSVVLEASLVMPIFIMFIFFLIYIVQMTITLGQMHTVSANAAKLVASHIYPISVVVENFKQSPSSNSNLNPSSISTSNINTTWSIPKLSLTEWSTQYTSKLPEPLSSWMKRAVDKGITPLEEIKTQVSEAVLDPIIKPLLRPLLKHTSLYEPRLHVSSITIPDLGKGERPYIGIELSYELPIKVPFTSTPIYLQTKSVERIWIGDTGEGREGDVEGSLDDGSKGTPATILLKPKPAYIGRKAKVKAKVEPGTTATLIIYYKSGVSTAKYLGEATADENGVLEWEWLVGGNTTPSSQGTLVVETETGARTVDNFDVSNKE
ncbi:hypothetical protein J2Z32_000051 [Paenibacillus turicensis]|uniref:Pilus assembly protein TadE n=1 Tax=Paenibacillus turicensis TaxID=160487 RepID=A0ABS4FLJ1_9BACL|nr:pilus assembly protein [Paenibacillus turicensis]MBP1903439.1 hypothetical protein [Paenibacillus turicensis]